LKNCAREERWSDLTEMTGEKKKVWIDGDRDKQLLQ
jgi:hypothetical protein